MPSFMSGPAIDRAEDALLDLVAAPAAEPLSTADAKAMLRVDHSSEDFLIASLVTAARELVEEQTGRALITQTWDMQVPRFPADGWGLRIPRAPLTSVTSVTYIDADGAEQTWAAESYSVIAPAGPFARRGIILPAHGVAYPRTQQHLYDVTVRFVAGYGAAATSVPHGLIQFIRLLISHWYDNRTPVITGTSASIASEVPVSLQPLLREWKLDKVVVR